jgi:hypothetical protein
LTDGYHNQTEESGTPPTSDGESDTEAKKKALSSSMIEDSDSDADEQDVCVAVSPNVGKLFRG